VEILAIRSKTTNEYILNIFSKIPIRSFKPIWPDVLIPYYHMVSDDDELHIKHLYPHKNIKQFISDIEFILNNFQPISLHDIIDYLYMGKKLPVNALHMTFDDGFSSIYDIVAPILVREGIPATFFINSGFLDNHNLCYEHKASIIVTHLLENNISNMLQKKIEQLLSDNYLNANSISASILAIRYSNRDIVTRIGEILEIDFKQYLLSYQPYLTTQQINNLISDGFTIGAHSIDHPLYKELALEEQLRQTTQSISFVREKFQLPYSVFAFPHTDNGVTTTFFNQIHKSRLVDISFGTSGMIEDIIPNNLQRISFENPLLPCKDIIALQCAKRMWRKIKHNNKIVRD
jgi:peptidoglycan/xylan/chitin deacetylase (PgdA/CDA1 family)